MPFFNSNTLGLDAGILWPTTRHSSERCSLTLSLSQSASCPVTLEGSEREGEMVLVGQGGGGGCLGSSLSDWTSGLLQGHWVPKGQW